MDGLRSSLDAVVTAGIRSYIGLLCAGEQVRSRRVLSDTMQLSSLGAGGPSTRVRLSLFADDPSGARSAGAGGLASSILARRLAFYTLRSLLASLLVLRATGYWKRVPELEQLRTACAAFNDELGEQTDVVSPAAARRHDASRSNDGRCSGECRDDDEGTGCPCGGTRSPAGGPGSHRVAVAEVSRARPDARTAGRGF